MKKCFLFIFIVFVGVTLHTPSQEVSRDELETAFKLANKHPLIPVRTTTREEILHDGKIVTTTVTVREMTMEAVRTLITEVNSRGSLRKEFIYLNGYDYTRIDNGAWVKIPLEPGCSLTQQNRITLYLDSRRFWKRSEPKSGWTVYGESVDIVESNVKGYIQDEYFFDDRMQFLKQVTTYGTKDSNSILRIVTNTKEHDPTISIKEPRN